MNSEDTIAKFEAQQEAIWNAVATIQESSVGLIPYATQCVIRWARALFELCPLQVGDAVEIVDPPEITQEKAWGWMGSKHLFVSGRRGHVRGIDHQDGEFCVYFEFDEQTWIYQEGVERPCDKKSLFFVAARRFRKIE